MELKDIKAIIDLMKKNDLSVFELERDGFKLKLQKGAGEQTVFAAVAPPAALMPMASAPPPAGTTGAAQPPPPAPTKSEPLQDILSPMVGTFYRAGSPESPAFVEIGQSVSGGERRLHYRGDESDERNQSRYQRCDRGNRGRKRETGAVRAGVVPGEVAQLVQLA